MTAEESTRVVLRFSEELWNHRDDLGLLQQLGVAVFAGAAPSPEE